MTINKEEYEKRNAAALKSKRSKIQYQLIPWEEFKQVGEVFTDGALKYAPEGWKQLEPEFYRGAIMRHIIAYMSGEKTDGDSGFDHLSHVIANAMILRWHDGRDTEKKA